MKIVMVAFAIVAAVSPAGAASFTKDGGSLGTGSYGYNYISDRWGLLPDGSFENGCGVNWTCTTDNSCVWIADLVPLGLWNYDGDMVAWLGGFCGGLATCYSSICQTLWLAPGALTWYWMGYVNDAVGVNTITFDGVVVYSHVLQLNEHLLGYQYEETTVNYAGEGELCFNVDNNAYCGMNMGDNWFVDYVESWGIVSTEDLSISTVKALY